MAFFDGLMRPTGGSLVGALAVAVVTGVALCVAPLEPLLTSGIMVLSHDDEYAWITAQALRAERAPGARRAAWVLASSATREGLTSSDALQADLARAGIGDQVTVLAAGGLGPHEALTLLDHLPVAAGDAVVVETSPRNFAWSPGRLTAHLERPRLPLHSPSLDAGARAAGLDPPRHVNSLLLAFPDFWSARLGALVHLVSAAPSVTFHLADQLAPPRGAQWAALDQRLVTWGTDCMAHFDPSAAIYRAISDHVAGLGAHLVLIQAPRNPAMLLRLDRARQIGERAACQSRIDALAATLDAPIIDPARAARVQGGAYIDHAHIIDPSARAAFTAAFVAALAEAW